VSRSFWERQISAHPLGSMKIATIVGARPQFVKAAIVSRILRATPNCSEVLVHTGQHYDENMSDVFFRELGIPRPDVNLGIRAESQGAQTGRMIEEIERVLLELQPERVLVYGDTNSTLAGALAAAKLHIPVLHVEAGLRSFNRRMPEEVNRVLTDHLSEFLFAPTTKALKNLAEEGIQDDRVHLVGDVMYDVALFFGGLAERECSILSRLNLPSKGYVLCTVHRAQNTDEGHHLNIIVEAINSVSEELPVVFPIHPRTRAALKKHGVIALSANVMNLPPVGYLDMLKLERHAAVIATDSGGIQKEAFFCRTPCVTLREETEWEELIQLNWNRLAPPTEALSVARSILSAIGSSGDTNAMPYGAGNAAERIVSVIVGSSHTGGPVGP
jgi:UDP-GlcNAc3NAcA epimerase